MEQTFLSLNLIFIHGNKVFQAVEMTMFSTNHFYGGFGKSYDHTNSIGTDLVICQEPLVMAEDESRNGSQNGVSESTQEEKDEGWLQLSIGGQVGIARQDDINQGNNNLRDGPGLVELELLPRSSSSISPSGPVHDFRPPRQFSNFPGFSPLSFLHQQADITSLQRQQEINNWTFRPVVPFNTSTASFSYQPSTSVAPGSYYSRPPFQIIPGTDVRPATLLPRPGLDFRVIPPPRRPNSGLWFKLQASKNQERELSLPQISKSYLRIKDGRMTIRLVMKYLVNRLSLENESEIEIRCKGQRLEPLLTLQHVRDSIWNSSNRDAYVTLLPNSSTVDHIMVLHYARNTAAN